MNIIAITTNFMKNSVLIHGIKNITKKCYLITLLLFIVAPLAHGQYLHTQGTKIVDSSGNPIHLNGINLGNWLLWEGYLMMGDFNYRTHTQFLNSLSGALGGMNNALEFEHQWRLHYVNETTIAELAGLGFNSVRVPFHYNMFWKNGQLSNHGFQYFDRLVQYCKAHGVYILLDMHAAPGYQNPGDHSDNINSNASQPRNSVGFWDGNNVNIASQVWRHIAARYANEPTIWGYDLINEPVPQAGREYELLPSLIQMRNAIRAVDNNHIIVAQGGWWGSDMSVIDWNNTNTRANTGVTSRWDNSLVYQTHHYVFGNAGAISDLNGRRTITNNLGVPFILGEYGEDSAAILRQMTDWSATNTEGQFPWSFKKMSHDKTLWTVQPNSVYNQIKNYINNGGTPPANAAQGMISFAQNNIANRSAGLQWHQDFYNAIKPTVIVTPPPANCSNAAYQTITNPIQAESFCAMQGVQTESTSDSDGGQNLGWLEVGDWMDFNINVPASGTYTVTYRVASTANTGEIQMIGAGGTLASTVVPNTGGWQTWTSITASVNLASGNQKIRLYVNGASFNINWFRIAAANNNNQVIANGIYTIINQGSGKALEVSGGALNNGANVQQWSAANYPHHQWRVTSIGNGQYTLLANHSGRALDVAGVSASNGANIHQWDYVGGNNQRWRIEFVSNNHYRILSVHSGKALDVADHSTADGANVHQWDYVGGANQLWRFE